MSDTTPMTEQERWLPVVGYEGLYEVSDQGRVRNKRRVMRASPDSSGHLRISLWNNAVRSTHAIHRLVLEAFVGPCPEGMEACHWDDDPTNNRLENLRWATHSDNTRDSVRNGTHVWTNKTHCPQGHSYAGDNLHINVNGWRECRECRRIQGEETLPKQKGCGVSDKNEGRDRLAQIIAESPVNAFGDTLYDAYFNVAPDMEKLADAILAAGFRPPARVVTTVEELDALPDRGVIVAADYTILQCVGSGQPDWDGNVWCDEESRWWGSGDVTLPATVLYEPEEGE